MRRIVTAAVLSLAAVLAACGPLDPVEPAAPATAPATAPTEPTAVKIGEPVHYGDSVFTVKAVRVDPKCSEYAPRPKGHVVALTVQVTAGKDEDVALLFNPLQLQAAGKDGVRHDVDLELCSDDAGGLKPDMVAGRRYAGVVEIEVREPAGTLVLSDMSGTEFELAYK